MIVEMAYTPCFMFFAQNVRQDSQIDLHGKMRFAIGTPAHQKKEAVSEMPRYIDADALLESLKNFTYAEPCTEFQRGVNAVVPLILSEIKHFHLADVVQAPEKTCSTCQCNKVCDHNKYGFENCGNYISGDVVELVRCKDCEHLTKEMIGDSLEFICKSAEGMVNPAPDFYCSYGKRKEDE